MTTLNETPGAVNTERSGQTIAPAESHSIPQRTTMTHIHPALTIEQHYSPFRLVVAWDGMELGTVTTYLAAEELGKEWLAHLLDEDALDAGDDVVLMECPVTHWTVQAATTCEPFTVAGSRFVWVACPAHDWNETVCGKPGYKTGHPGAHLLNLSETPPPQLWQSRYPVEATC